MHVMRELGRRQIARSFSAGFLRGCLAGPRRACARTHGPCGFGPGRPARRCMTCLSQCLPSHRLLLMNSTHLTPFNYALGRFLV
jgi:hypothetical protein